MSDSLDGFTEGDTQKEKQKVKQPKPFFNDVEESADRRHLRWTKSGVTLAMTILVAVIAKWHLNRSQFGIRIDHDLASISDHSLASQSITIWHASDH
ncbi:hypothetical protein YD90_004547 [Salmonella enterica subsp. enterica serovar Panama]|nr:hypothetical protein [Salmonella enterica subsp. enterica serovar Panama]EHJ9282318.1 hypothetical protein [Salmonella enterica subsp. enterica serovar Panama]EHJ9300753.1 hypothetical protein [Salmonella enterica subsp. enterica serovar Panama]EHJ9679796.1 hypothetical protein [Salmonella enterica subsp. enterica serovar Panama]